MDELQQGEDFFQLLRFLRRVKAEDVLLRMDAQRLQDLLAGVAARFADLGAVGCLHLNGADLEQHGHGEIHARRNDAQQQGKGRQAAEDAAAADGRPGKPAAFFALPAAGAAEVCFGRPQPLRGAILVLVMAGAAARVLPALGPLVIVTIRIAALGLGELDAVVRAAGRLRVMAHLPSRQIQRGLLIPLGAAALGDMPQVQAVYPTNANFVLFKVGRADLMWQMLYDQGVWCVTFRVALVSRAAYA